MKPQKTVMVPCDPVSEGSSSLAITDARKKKKIRVDKIPGLTVLRDDENGVPPHVRLPVLKYGDRDVQVELPDGEAVWVRELEQW